jgi:hypothetical protein
MKTNNDSFFAAPVDPKQEARFLALEVVCRLLVWMAEAASLDERGVRATVALYCVRPDLINEATLEEIGHVAGRTKQAVRGCHHEPGPSYTARRGGNQPPP